MQGIYQGLRFQEVSIAQGQIRIGHVAHRAQRGLKGVRVLSTRDKPGDRGILACDVAGHIRQNGRRRNHAEAIRGIHRCRGRAACRKEGDAKERPDGLQPARYETVVGHWH